MLRISRRDEAICKQLTEPDRKLTYHTLSLDQHLCSTIET
ncbi:putative tail tubular protein B [Salmonella phage 18-India]|nr:putative tail tubular protein B [Salmonella phage 18-India]